MPEKSSPTRRQFLKNSCRIATSVLGQPESPFPRRRRENNTIQVAVVGCGQSWQRGRRIAFREHGPVKLVALADVFPPAWPSGLARSRRTSPPARLTCRRSDSLSVSTPIGRPSTAWAGRRGRAGHTSRVSLGTLRLCHRERRERLHGEADAVDGPSSRKMLALAEESVQKNLKVGVGLMFRHARDRIELYQRIQDGQLGQIIALRAYRMHGPMCYFSSGPKPNDISELLYQVQRFHSFLWASGGAFSDFYIHGIDECCWMKDAWPVKRRARAAALSRRFDRPELRQLFGRVHVCRRHEVVPGGPDDGRLLRIAPPATPTAPRAPH